MGSQPKIDKIIASIRTGKVSQEEGFQRLLEETDIESCIRWAIRGTAKSASEQEVEDLVSTAWEEIYEGFASFDPEKGTFKGWAKTIAHHKAVDHIRAAKASPEERSLDAPIGSSEQTLGDSLRSAETPPIEWVIEKEMVETILVTLMKKLSDVNRTLYLLRLNYDLTYKELAEIASRALGETFTEKAIQNRIYRAQEKIYAALTDRREET